MNPAKLKVVELRAELSARGLDTKGNKAVLVERLQEALDLEGGNGGVTATVHDDDEGVDEQNDTQAPAETIEQEQETESEPEPLQQNKVEAPPEKLPIPQNSEEPSVEPAPPPAEPSPEKSPQSTPEKSSQKALEKSPLTPQKTLEKSPHTTLQKTPEKNPLQSTPQKTSPVDISSKDTGAAMEVDTVVEKQTLEKEKGGLEAIKEEKEDPGYEKNQKQTENGCKEGYEQDVKVDIKTEEIKHETETTVKTEPREYNDRKRKRSASPSPRTGRPLMDRDPVINDDAVTLSWYDSDLNLTIDEKDFLSATPMSDGGFGYVWAGVRGTHGYTSGHVCYQVKVTNFLDVSHLEDEPNPNVLRVGWSIFTSSLQLGEEPFSYGYGGTGKFSVDCKFSDYGKPFGLNDVLTCYLEFTPAEAILSYSLNDDYLGVAHRIPLESLDGRALAPHILTKNSAFVVNFGQSDVPWSQVKEEATFLSKYPIEKAVQGPKRPEKRSDCEMIMMCGLPACGKTTWANKYITEHPDKHYNILGTNALIDKMKVMGLPRKANYHGRWDVLIEKSTKCLQRLTDIGCHRRRNYILDQTNVYPAAQKRKMRNFEGFTRKAVVIVPTDEEFRSRTEKQSKEEKKDVPESAVLEMKANFTLPDKDLFEEVMFVELPEDKAQELIEKYAKEAAAKGVFRKQYGPPAKRFRGGDNNRPRNDIMRRDRFHPSGAQSSQYRRGSDRGGPRGGGGGGSGGSWGAPRGGNMDRWRDNRSSGSSGYGRPSGDRSGYRGPQGGSGGRGPSRDYDHGPPSRSGGYDRNSRSSGGPPFRSGGGGGYNSRDQRDHPRGPSGNGQKSGLGGKPRSDSGKHGGSGGSNSSQWNNQSQNQGYGQSASSGNQGSWGGQQASQWDNQSWNNYQQQWKGYQQGYNQQQQSQQQGYGQQQGYNPQQQYNWPQQQQYYNYNQQGGWGQNSDGSYNYPQSWQNWYAAQNAGQTNTSHPPPSAK